MLKLLKNFKTINIKYSNDILLSMLKTKVLIFTKPMFSYFLSLKIFTHILSASFSLILCEICENLAICYSLLKCGIERSKIIKISIIMLAIIKYKRFYSIILNIQG